MTFADYNINIRQVSGQARTICPQCSHLRKKPNDPCLSVNVDDGVWLCHNCGWNGGLKEGKEKGLNDKIVSWFLNRGIDNLILERNQIGWTGEYITFPYFKNGKIVNIKYRDLEKNFRQVKDAEKIFYGHDDCVNSEEIIIVEGEIDKLSLETIGYKNCLSVPDGAPSPATKTYEMKFSYLETCSQLFEKCKKIIIAVDGDSAGKRLEEELIRRLGVDKCYRVKWLAGCKDANEVLSKHGKNELKRIIDTAEAVPVEGLYEVRQFFGEIDKLYEHGFVEGLSTGFMNLDTYYTVRAGEWTVVTGVPSHGKALSLDTPIPTPSGWATMDNIKIGDVVYDEKGNECNITKATDVLFNHKCFEIEFSDGTKIIADSGHQWFTLSEKARRSVLQTKNKRGKRDYTLPRGTDQRHKKTYSSIVTTEYISQTLKSQNKNNHQIPISYPIKGKKENLPIEPYTLGAWLGDGHSSCGRITCFEKEIMQKIKKDGYKLSEQKGGKNFVILGIQQILRNIGILENKHIPEIYLRTSINQRMELLRGLMDTDGCCNKIDHRCEYTSVNKKLAEGVLELVLSLGIKATMIKGRSMLYEKDCGEKYRITFNTGKKVFYLERKNKRLKTGCRSKFPVRAIIKCSPINSVPVKCIEVDSPSHLFLVSKSFIATHNSAFVDALAVNLAMEYGWRFAFFSPENQPIQRHIATIISKYTGKPFLKGVHERIDKEGLEQAKQWLNEYFYFILPPEGNLQVKSILTLAKIAVTKYGIRGLILDPWNEFDHSRPAGMNETEYISACLGEIRRFARTYQVHVWIIAHPTKLQKTDEGKYPTPSMYDISGSAHWRNKADNGLCVFRDLLDENKEIEIHIQKVRFREIGRVGMVKLNYDIVTGRYKESYGN